MLIRQGHFQFAIGMQWRLLRGKEEIRAELRKQRSVRAVVQVRVGRETCLGLYSEAPKESALAGALAVGILEADAIVCHALDAQRTWLCVIGDGVPYPEHDRILPQSEALRLVAEWRERSPESVLVGDLPEAQQSLPGLLAEFERRANRGSLPRRQLAALRLRRRGLDPAAIARWVAVGAIPVIALAAWHAWQGVDARMRAARDASESAARAAALQERRQAERRRLADAYHRQVSASRAKLSAQVSRSIDSQWRSWNAARRSVPQSAYGYRPLSMRCDSTLCEVSWQLSDLAGRLVPLANKRLLPHVVADTGNSFSATSRIPVTPLTVFASPRRGRFASAVELRVALFDALYPLVPLLELSAPEAIAVALPATPTLLSVPSDSPETIGYVGELHIRFEGPIALVEAEDAVRELARWPVYLSSVVFESITDASSVDITGSYVWLVEAPEA